MAACESDSSTTLLILYKLQVSCLIAILTNFTSPSKAVPHFTTGAQKKNQLWVNTSSALKIANHLQKLTATYFQDICFDSL